MWISKIIRIGVFVLTTALFSCHSFAAVNYDGEWVNNGSGNTHVGNLNLSDKKLIIRHMATYAISKTGVSGKSLIFRVLGVNKKHDPNGCGPSDKASYIVISPLPPLEGLDQEAIYVYFYGRSKPPVVEKLKNDPAVCSIYSYGRDSRSNK